MSLLNKLGWAPTAIVILSTLGLLAYYPGPICPDVSGQFWLAHAIRHGSRLYTDLVEINPPLWFWMAVPIDWLGEVVHVRTEPLTIITVAAWVFLAIGATRRLIKGHYPPTANLFLAYLALILLIMPLQLIEQREHLALIGAVPYLVLVSQRAQRRQVSPLIAGLVGVGAALGFSLKPYFLAVPILTEGWLIYRLGRQWRPIRPESAALAGTGALYLLAVVLLTPRFLTDVLPRLFPVYEAAAPLNLSVGILPIVWFFMLAGLAFYRRSILAGKAPLTEVFLVGFVAFAASYFAQHKGWIYQGLPATGCLALALGAVVMEQGWPAGRLRLFLPALLSLPFAFAEAHITMSITPSMDIAPAFSHLKRGDAFGLISTIGPTTWPSIVDGGFVNASRYGQYWMVSALDAHPADPAVRQAVAQAVRDTVLDFRCLPPKVIVFTRSDRAGRHHRLAEDPYRLFIKDAAFANVLSHYTLSMSYGIFDVYRPATPIPPIDSRLCRHVS